MNETDSNTCPKCGSEQLDNSYQFECGSDDGYIGGLRVSMDCLQRQIDQLRTAYLELRLECTQAINGSGPPPENP